MLEWTFQFSGLGISDPLISNQSPTYDLVKLPQETPWLTKLNFCGVLSVSLSKVNRCLFVFSGKKIRQNLTDKNVKADKGKEKKQREREGERMNMYCIIHLVI